MTLQTFHCVASDVLSVAVKPTGRAGVWFLNWSLKAISVKKRRASEAGASFQGPGLYGLCFDGYLVYVGSYLGVGKGGAFMSGDVVRSRWWTHIGAISGRGSRVSVAPGSLRGLEVDPGRAHPLVAGLLSMDDLPGLHRGSGNLAPERRLRFAARHASVFLDRNAVPEAVLGRFQYVYCRFDAMPHGLNPKSLRDAIERAERSLITRLAPVCNHTHVPDGQSAVEVPFQAVGGLLAAELMGLGPHSLR
jgi:hypothetical protein